MKPKQNWVGRYGWTDGFRRAKWRREMNWHKFDTEDRKQRIDDLRCDERIGRIYGAVKRIAAVRRRLVFSVCKYTCTISKLCSELVQ